MTGSAFTEKPVANANTLPFIAVNREIGLSVTGTYRGTASNSEAHYSCDYAGRPSYNYSDMYGRTRWSGWMPGFRAQP
ncbi:hypothetical protein [Acetobacter fallax]|uniref:hypothetical protein n=1 Tax=Acetobacter fallax TaxID=1737473 RepID=UPI00156AFD44|nr:hypothetical protein [Acetobacter fallax]NHO37576.1 hypothetical protein [Acetobacter fallax]